jgi:NAD(P)H dehydrogenase (quinone)
MSSSNIAVIYYSATGSVHRLASAVAEGAADAGAEVRLRRVAELAPGSAIDTNPAWRAHLEETRDTIQEATLGDLDWADGFAFGTPTRYGNVCAQLKQFLDQTGPLWMAGKLSDKAATSFTSAINRHGGQESTLLSFNNVFYHWGAVIVPPGYTDPLLYAAGGNPYGTSFIAGIQGDRPGQEILAAARYQGRRLAEVAGRLQGFRHERQQQSATAARP